LIAATVVVASEFLSGGLVVVTDGPEGITEYHVEEGGLATSGVPLTVLVNEGSASASEVLAGLLQERGRARLVGATTFGKGSVQIPVRLRNQGILRVTIAGWITPQGTDVEGVGVVPDVALDLPRGLPVAELLALAEAA
jgi:carboxyl-terminal processing protease